MRGVPSTNLGTASAPSNARDTGTVLSRFGMMVDEDFGACFTKKSYNTAPDTHI